MYDNELVYVCEGSINTQVSLAAIVWKPNTTSRIHIQSVIQSVIQIILAGSATLLSSHESQLELLLKRKISCYRFNKWPGLWQAGQSLEDSGWKVRGEMLSPHQSPLIMTSV